MERKLFISKKNNSIYLFISLIIFLLLIIYILSLYLNLNKSYFIIENNSLRYFVIPDDKEGEKVNYLDKKSLNNLSNTNLEKKYFSNIDNVKFTIQVKVNSDYNEINKYLNELIKLKSEIISMEDFFIFPLVSNIGVDYFLSYKNFDTRLEAINYCSKITFIKNCLVLNIKKD
ncbi:hypothetical protein OA492_00800 [Pelagibacteraceae bacterium]|nr:hypothetical protein [Pelagibacteraceae bacterium]